MDRTLKVAALVICTIALLGQWVVVSERIGAAIWNWYKFWGYGGSEPLVVGKQAQLMFYTLTAVFTALALLVRRSSKESWFAKVASWQVCGFISALFVWTAVLASPLVAPFSSWR